jgi:N-acetyl-gamma-glutamyl-phosphate/LysW-gamma-L-alpha-aminoadipyl-6-phosphate reductase
MSIRVGVVGATGLVGGELLRLLAVHPGFSVALAAASGRGHDPRDARDVVLSDLHPHLVGGPIGNMPVARTRVSEISRQCTAVFLATPPSVSASIAPALLDHGVDVVVDLSAAFRLSDPALHQRWYPDVMRPAGRREAVYGLPELSRDRLPGARLIAVPGCLATASILALLPLSEMRGTRFTAIALDAKSGSAGSGIKPRRSGMHALRSRVVAPYAPVTHRHSAEIREALTARGLATAGGGLRLGMSAYGVDLVRGASVAASVWFDGEVSSADLTQLFVDSYEKERFVRVRDWSGGTVPLPDPRAVTGSNYCDLAPFVDHEAGRLVIIAVLATLMKGAAGQAVQACNARFGFPEDAGLSAQPVFPT